MAKSPSWLPESFVPPERVQLPTGHVLRPVVLRDLVDDHTGSLGQRQQAHREHRSFSYVIVRSDEVVIGCLYIDPPDRAGADAEASWWVAEDQADPMLDFILETFLPAWLRTDWPFTEPRIIGVDVSWHDWSMLPPAS